MNVTAENNEYLKKIKHISRILNAYLNGYTIEYHYDIYERSWRKIEVLTKDLWIWPYYYRIKPDSKNETDNVFVPISNEELDKLAKIEFPESMNEICDDLHRALRKAYKKGFRAAE